MSGERPKVMLGELLTEKGVISPDQLRIALTEQQRQDKPVGKVLVELGFVSEGVMRDILGEALGQQSVDLSKVVVDPEAVKLVSKEFAKRVHMLPIAYDRQEHHLTVAMSNTFNVVALDQMRSLLGEDVRITTLLAGDVEIDHAIDQFFGFEWSVEGILREMETGEVDQASLSGYSSEYSQPLVRLVDALLSDAVKRGASDIHFEPEERFLRIRYRIDGVMRQIRSLHSKYQSMITVRIKVMAGLNIAETRIPQDGHVSLQLFGRPIDFRVSCMAVTFGENLVLRILDRQKGILSLEAMGFTETSLNSLRLMMARPEGMILVTGPTGSGKTTTLYSMLDSINNESINIMTLEDPVEYPLRQIRQSQVNPMTKMGFADGVRAMLRQDPDVILVGEIRDRETAEMAMRAAMTGHQVYSTVHANSAIKAIGRLLDIGVPRDLLSGNLIGVLGQRLVRRLCTHCRRPYEPGVMERSLLGLEPQRDAGVIIYGGLGCPHCDFQGYKGRLAILEVLRFDEELDELIIRSASFRDLERLARSKGFQSLADDGIRCVLQGLTDLDEVSRVVDLTQRIRQGADD
ncbi:MAG: type II/IV secretion system protein [Magnetococcales bacterium]|nr:type II/IV secretion system protein [Magnetococcales bacterium]MBF0150816.1 type II/IV secretion system protein [Magnetococcales bacterium]MBF0172338.1 type II/IV secretion system protein [Magnetococcales bacterium]MBF0348489.1 type II/IV secretion system protein [Magnetococcales bacterium]MBF0629675.1 type II/IV secretion system protein [Magnetococcales bacterium]